MIFSEENTEIMKAYVQFQGKITNPKLNKVNAYYNSKYSTLDSIIEHVRPVLEECGLAVIQDTKTSEDNMYVGTTTRIVHESGQWVESSRLWLPAFKLLKNGQKTYDAQAVGIAITYSRRYTLTTLLNLASEEDDDANNITHDSATPKRQVQPQLLTDAQKTKIEKLIEEKRGSMSKEEFYQGIKEFFNMDIPIDKLKPAGAKLIIEHLAKL